MIESEIIDFGADTYPDNIIGRAQEMADEYFEQYFCTEMGSWDNEIAYCLHNTLEKILDKTKDEKELSEVLEKMWIDTTIRYVEEEEGSVEEFVFSKMLSLYEYLLAGKTEEE